MMSCKRRMIPLFLQFCIFLLVNASFSSATNRTECKACISLECTYCKGNTFFDNPSVCVCEGLNDGFFESCSDHSFGSDPLDTKWDCQFNSPWGNRILIVIIVASIVGGSCLLAGCLRLLFSKSSTGDSTPPKQNQNQSSYNQTQPTPNTNIFSNVFANTMQQQYAHQTAVVFPPSTAPHATSIPIAVAAPLTNMNTAGGTDNSKEPSAFDQLNAAL